MGIKDWINYKYIIYCIKKAKKKGYGSLIKHYGLYLPELTPVVRRRLANEGIKISEM